MPDKPVIHYWEDADLGGRERIRWRAGFARHPSHCVHGATPAEAVGGFLLLQGALGKSPHRSDYTVSPRPRDAKNGADQGEGA